MAIYKLTKDALTALTETRLEAEGILERKDLQRLLRSQIRALDPDLMVISEEFGGWVESSRRIDLLCLDKNANLVVVELKRTEDGGHMELQAIRYAAMVSKMTFLQLISTYENHLKSIGESTDDTQNRILQFLNWDEPQEDKFAQDVRIILASPNFSKELTTSVMWLNDFDVDIRCVRLKPYRDADGLVLLDIQQLIPLPEATQYQTQIKAKDQATRAERGDRKSNFRFSFVGIKPGAELQSVFDDAITCTVKDDRSVIFLGEEESLSSSALKIAHEKGFGWITIAGPQYWKYNGKTLAELRDEASQEG